MTYAQQEGFRCWTCHPFPTYGALADCPVDIKALPLIVMDGTLYKYRGLSPKQGKEQILTLARRCQQVEGTFTLLWHNTLLIGGWESWAPVYRATIKELAHLAANPQTGLGLDQGNNEKFRKQKEL